MAVRASMPLEGQGGRVIARQFGVNPGTVQRISRPFAHGVAAVVQ